jgi:hypothetical protein
MAVTAGALSKVAVGQTTASLLSAAATAGTGPYTYQWYRSTSSGFSPGGGNIVSGATALTLSDTGLTAGTQYYYKVVATDTGDSNLTSTSAQLAVATSAASQSQNQFAQSAVLGQPDLAFNYDTISVQIDSSEAGTLYAGSAVKIVDSAGGIPKVVKCAANSDSVLGFISYNIKDKSFVAGSRAEISMSGNVLWLQATGAIARGVQVQLDITQVGGVAAKVGSSGANIVGWALDKATGGQLVRIFITSPSFTVA